MRRHTGNISSGSVLFAYVIFTLRDSAVVDVPKYGQYLNLSIDTYHSTPLSVGVYPDLTGLRRSLNTINVF